MIAAPYLCPLKSTTIDSVEAHATSYAEFDAQMRAAISYSMGLPERYMMTPAQLAKEQGFRKMQDFQKDIIAKFADLAGKEND